MGVKFPVEKDIARTTFAVLLIVILSAAVFWILRPFIPSLVWATIIVIALWPSLIKLQTVLRGRRGLATTVMTILLLVIVVAPLTIAVAVIAGRVDDITTWVKSLPDLVPSAPPAWIDHIPLVGRKIAGQWERLASLSSDERQALMTPYVTVAGRWFMGHVGGIAAMIFQFLLTVIIAAILFAKGETAASGIISFVRRLAGQQGEDAVILAAKSIRGVALGIGVTAAVQAGIGGIGLTVAGVPAVAILTALMFMLCLAQLGPAFVLLPAVGWLYWSGSAFWGTVLLAISLIALTIDNFLRPFLIRKGVDLPLVLIFAGVIGGLISFGIVGLFIGPVVLAVALTLVQTWVSDSGSTPGSQESANETSE